jgi:hypothetical protein
MRHSITIAVITGVLTCGFAHAGDVYKYVDERGQTLYTDKPIPGAVKVASTVPKPTATASRSFASQQAATNQQLAASNQRISQGQNDQRVAANVAKDLEALRLGAASGLRHNTSINSQRLYKLDRMATASISPTPKLSQRHRQRQNGRNLRPQAECHLLANSTDAGASPAFSVALAPDNLPMLRVGFAGLGAMGAPMARNLHKAGLLKAVWNRSREKSLALGAELGVSAPASLDEFAALLDVAIICVSADADVRAVIEGLAPGLARGALVIDCSTVGADTARWAGEFLAGRGVRFVDAPVSGGVEGAKNGTLAIMCGGEP